MKDPTINPLKITNTQHYQRLRSKADLVRRPQQILRATFSFVEVDEQDLLYFVDVGSARCL